MCAPLLRWDTIDYGDTAVAGQVVDIRNLPPTGPLPVPRRNSMTRRASKSDMSVFQPIPEDHGPDKGESPIPVRRSQNDDGKSAWKPTKVNNSGELWVRDRSRRGAEVGTQHVPSTHARC